MLRNIICAPNSNLLQSQSSSHKSKLAVINIIQHVFILTTAYAMHYWIQYLGLLFEYIHVIEFLFVQ